MLPDGASLAILKANRDYEIPVGMHSGAPPSFILTNSQSPRSGKVIGDKLHAAGWRWGYCSAVTNDA
jgi:hypothetical protein